MDGLTTNGVLILHPLSGQHGVVSNGPGVWREISIVGDVYGLRKARSDRGAGKKVSERIRKIQVYNLSLNICFLKNMAFTAVPGFLHYTVV